MNKRRILAILAICLLLVLIFGCAPGNVRFDDNPAGFWAGLWHGLISLFTFIISLFSDSVRLYELTNTGGWYDFGFILGISIFWGGGCKSQQMKKGKKEKEWDKIATKVEEKIRTGIKNWLSEVETKDKEWEEIGQKIEEKIKRELRNWAEK
jgi:hypothetical protein